CDGCAALEQRAAIDQAISGNTGKISMRRSLQQAHGVAPFGPHGRCDPRWGHVLGLRSARASKCKRYAVVPDREPREEKAVEDLSDDLARTLPSGRHHKSSSAVPRGSLNLPGAESSKMGSVLGSLCQVLLRELLAGIAELGEAFGEKI